MLEHCHLLIQAQCGEEIHNVPRVSKDLALPYFTTLINSKLFTFKITMLETFIQPNKQKRNSTGPVEPDEFN